MELKTFAPGFDQSEVNEFLAHNIIYKCHFLEDGTLYVFWRDPAKAGATGADLIEELDKLIKQAEVETLVAELDIVVYEEQAANARAEMAQYKPNQKEYQKFEAEALVKENAVLMAKETLKERAIQVAAFRARIAEITKSL